ncbi:phosphoribosylglycinamide formyltransferase [Faucicola boevrei]|uniref:phosphoribosylglycinamide formyltransferase n=1 Tax=Faucicola boevrei TaxID=346665 RepID=UPI0003631A2F|nr:phosphoribosylglycinamide formyltransferase [Moraxella boevrei]
MKNLPLKLAVLVSGSGSNLQVLIDKQLNNTLNIQIVGVISNKETAYALTRAKSANINTFVIDKDDTGKTYKRIEFEKRALDILKELQPNLVVLAGFMKILTPLFINGVNHELNIPMINLHPSILPAYKGLDTHARVLRAGEKYHGCSVHLVTEELDAGAVIAQAVTQVKECETADELQARIHTLEHKLLPMMVGWFADDIVVVNNGKLVSRLGTKLPMKICFDEFF